MNEELIPIRRAEIAIGQPLPWAVYDAQGVLLLNKGVVVGSEFQLQTLIEKGLYRRGGRDPRRDYAASDKASEEGGLPDLEGGALTSFDRILLTPGDLVQLSPMQDTLPERYNVRYLGMLKGKSLMVTTPVVDDKVLFVREGQTFLVRAFAGLDVCGFKAQVLASHMRPYPYLHLRYSHEVQVMRVRRALRAPVDIIVAAYERAGGKLKASARMVDLSAGGAKLHSRQSLGAGGDTLYLTFKVVLDDIEEIISIPSQVRSVAQEVDDRGQSTYATGVQFLGLERPQRLILMNLVYRHLYKEV